MVNDVLAHQTKRRMYEANQCVLIVKRADRWGLASLGNHIKPDRHNSDVVILPNRALQLDALLEVFNRGALSYCDMGLGHSGAV
jgi:hypothetical protein